MKRPSFPRVADALLVVAVYAVACALAVPLLALGGAQLRVRAWLRRAAP